MGQRLNIELTDGEKILANCCFQDAAYTEAALDLTELLIKTYDDIFGGSGATVEKAILLLEIVGAGFNGIERNRISRAKIDIPAPMHLGRESGLIGVTSEGIRENRRRSDSAVIMNLKDRTLDFHAHLYTFCEEYIDFTERVPGCIEWEDLPKIEAGPDIFTGIYFDHLYMVRKIIERCPDGLRLQNGDVIEWT